MMDPAELHRRCLEEDPAAWAELDGLVRMIVASSVRNPRIDVEDLSQEIMLWLHVGNRLAKVKDPRKLRSFLWPMVRRKALELLEARWTKVERPVAPRRDDARTDPLVRLAGSGALLAMPIEKKIVHHQALREAWTRLSEEDRDVLCLFERYKGGEITYDRMMAIADVAIRGTMAARIHRAGGRLLAKVKELGITM